MPFKKPVCSKCSKTESLMWTPAADGSVLCNECYDYTVALSLSKELEQEQEKTVTEELGPKIATRKSTRITRNSTKSTGATVPAAVTVKPKGKSRRIIFKKTCMKAPSAVATPVTSSYVFYKGQYYQIGDIVSCIDDDGDVYYAQIRGFLTDQYCEKSAVITWLLPTEKSPPPERGFDPATYIIGWNEDIPRKLECFQFIMHAPSDYYKSSTTPFPPVDCDPFQNGFIWTRMANENGIQQKFIENID